MHRYLRQQRAELELILSFEQDEGFGTGETITASKMQCAVSIYWNQQCSAFPAISISPFM
jgi:hypothetical protein